MLETAADIQAKLLFAPGFSGEILQDANNRPFGVIVKAEVNGHWIVFRREIDVEQAQLRMVSLHKQGLMSSISASSLKDIEKVRRIVMRQLLDWVSNGISDVLLGSSSGPIETFSSYLSGANGEPLHKQLIGHILALEAGNEEDALRAILKVKPKK